MSLSTPSSCDTFVALPPATVDGRVIFGKNSDRPASEVQEIIFVPPNHHLYDSTVKCTYIEIRQVPNTHGVILSKPAWMWGAEMGANDQGVCVGNEAVWNKLNGPDDLQEKLLGMDLVRLALERACSASEGVDVIGELLQEHGQGGPCSEEPGKTSFAYHNSFLIADPISAWVLETAGPLWAAEHITGGIRNISNELSIRTKIDRSSSNLIEEARRLGLYNNEMASFDFAMVFSNDFSSRPSTSSRHSHGLRLLKEYSANGKFGIKHMCQILRDKDSGICVTDGDFQTTGSQVSVLVPPSPTVTLSPHCHWFTGTPNPFNSIYKPFIFVPGATIGLAILSPQFGDEDPVKQLPRFKKQVDRRHTLYRLHETFIKCLHQKVPKATSSRNDLMKIEEKCIDDLEDVMANFDGTLHAKIANIFDHICSIEMNFYN